RWLKGNWRPIDELWEELGINPREVVPIDPECLAEIEARGDEVQRTEWRLRCAQPPYDAIPIPRADIPPGYILSREADAWMHEDEVEDVALPLYTGRMINIWDWAANGVNYGGGSYVMAPDYLLAQRDLRHNVSSGCRLVFRDIARTTDQRTV